jgi:hypothetical protein
MPRDLLLVVHGAGRARGRLDDLHEPGLPPAQTMELERFVEDATARNAGSRPLLSGGEPTLRADLPRLIEIVAQACARIGETAGLRSDGAALGERRVLRGLMERGLGRLRIPFHSARADAHDWLAGWPGALRAAAAALKAAAALALPAEAELALCRPTARGLSETVELLARLSVERVLFRVPRLRFALREEAIAVAPRLPLLGASLEEAVAAAERHRLAWSVTGVPPCALPRLPPGRLNDHSVAELLPAGAAWDALRPAFATPPRASGCPRCPGAPLCEGAPADLVERFGWPEILALRGAGPELRVPDEPRSDGAASSLRVVVPSPETSGRALRQVFVRAAASGAGTLRVTGDSVFSHGEAPALLREALRLSFPRVEFCGEGSALASFDDDALHRLRRAAAFRLAFFGPDAPRHDARIGRAGAFEAGLRAARRLASLREPAHADGGSASGPEVSAHAVLASDGPAELADWAAAWESGQLPGAPAFRLGPDGGSLSALAAAAGRLASGPARDAIACRLPPCVLPRPDSVAPAPAAEASAAGDVEPGSAAAALARSDPRGGYDACMRGPSCDPSRCPGVARGWSLP